MGTAKGNFGRKMYQDPAWRKAVSQSNKLSRVTIKKKCKCGTEFTVIRTVTKNGIQNISNKERKCCSRQCANRHIQSSVTKLKISSSLKNRYKPFKIQKECLNCQTIFEVSIHSTQTYCSRECHYLYIRRSKGELEKYRWLCMFKFNLADFPNEFDFDLVRHYGWYKAKNKGDNLGGVSRDHVVSVDYGFKNNISPSLISHPANCRLMLHTDNSKKHNHSGMTIKELEDKIKNWNIKYAFLMEQYT